MKISALIEILSNHNPNSEILGVENLIISSQLIEPAVKAPESAPRRKFNFLKGQNRLEAATAPGSAKEVAEMFRTTPEYIIFLRKKISNGKFKMKEDPEEGERNFKKLL